MTQTKTTTETTTKAKTTTQTTTMAKTKTKTKTKTKLLGFSLSQLLIVANHRGYDRFSARRWRSRLFF